MGCEVAVGEQHRDRRGHGRFRTEQPPYSLLTRAIEYDLLPTCLRHGMGVMAYSPLAGGWLSGRWRLGADDLTSRRAAMLPQRYDLSLPGNQRKLEAADALALSDRLAVMDGGDVLQVGDPGELYRRPSSRSVADALGPANFLAVRVVEVRELGVVVETEAGHQVPVAGIGSFRKGSLGLMVLRPETLSLVSRRVLPYNAQDLTSVVWRRGRQALEVRRQGPGFTGGGLSDGDISGMFSAINLLDADRVEPLSAAPAGAPAFEIQTDGAADAKFLVRMYREPKGGWLAADPALALRYRLTATAFDGLPGPIKTFLGLTPPPAPAPKPQQAPKRPPKSPPKPK